MYKRQHLNLIRDAQADIRSRQIEIEKLFLGNLGSHARFRVDSDGHMVVHEPVSVGSTSGPVSYTHLDVYKRQV